MFKDFDFEIIVKSIPFLLEGMGLTLMLTFFACVLVDMGRREDIARPWSAAALAALAAVWLLPPNWHILAGGIAGGLVGACANDR